MKLKITSDGTRAGTYLSTLDGELIENVLLVSWNLSLEDEMSIAMVELLGVPCEIITEYRNIEIAAMPMQDPNLVVEDEDWIILTNKKGIE
jgi:hypothetical protein